MRTLKTGVLDPSERKLHHGHAPPSVHARHIGEKCTYLMVIVCTCRGGRKDFYFFPALWRCSVSKISPFTYPSRGTRMQTLCLLPMGGNI